MIKQNEYLCILVLKGVLDLQCHLTCLVEEINTHSSPLPVVPKLFPDEKEIYRKRTLSFRHSFGTLPVIKEQFGLSSFYQFNITVKALLQERFKDITESDCEVFFNLLNTDYLLKNFLINSNISLHLTESLGPLQAISNYYRLYGPAHENIRRKICKGIKSSVSFLAGVTATSKQIMGNFDRNTLTQTQIDRLMAVNPMVRYSSRHLKDIIHDALAFRESNESECDARSLSRLSKKKNRVKSIGGNMGRKGKKDIEVIDEDSEEEVIGKRGKNLRESTQKVMWKTQRDMKQHLNGLNSLLIKSSKRTLK